MPTVKFHENADESLLKYAVIVARANGKWVFCKHKERDTWECPGGHREAGETIEETAKRELYEETGAVKFTLTPVCFYSFGDYGMLYYAQIDEFEDELHSEIERIELFENLPEKWTYPMIQPYLLAKVKEKINI